MWFAKESLVYTCRTVGILDTWDAPNYLIAACKHNERGIDLVSDLCDDIPHCFGRSVALVRIQVCLVGYAELVQDGDSPEKERSISSTPFPFFRLEIGTTGEKASKVSMRSSKICWRVFFRGSLGVAKIQYQVLIQSILGQYWGRNILFPDVLPRLLNPCFLDMQVRIGKIEGGAWGTCSKQIWWKGEYN